MADKKRMSVEEMLAAARKADGGAAAPPNEVKPAEHESSTAEAPVSDAPVSDAPVSDAPVSDAPASDTPAAKAPAASPSGPAKPAKSASGGRLSVAEMLAKARAEKSGGGSAAQQDAPAPAAAKTPAGKPTPKKEAAASAPTEPRDTASILAAARKSSKAGPMSKAEAAAKSKSDPVKADRTQAKKKIVVPPMPVKPAYAKPQPAAKAKGATDEERRDFLSIGFGALAIVGGLWTFLTVKFMFPNVLREPPSKFKVGFPDSFPAGQVQTKYKAQYGVWVANADYNGERQIYALKSVCTHLGCTPSWLEAEQKFKCPCHGSGFYKDGINFEGPAPRPLERCAIRIADDGQIEIDKSRTFQEEMGQWRDPTCYVPV